MNKVFQQTKGVEEGRKQLKQAMHFIEFATVLTTCPLLWQRYGLKAAVRYLLGLSLALLLQRGFLSAISRKTDAQASLANMLTLSRAAAAGTLAGLVVSHIRDRTGFAGRLGWWLILLGATVTDWLDGPLARLTGVTSIGGVLDIEADSWLTLWSAASAVAWGDLSRWCLLAPLIRYLDPLLSLQRGQLPRGGGPWWSRATGTGQMLLFLVALAPINWPWRRQVLSLISLPISLSQCAALLILLSHKWRGHDEIAK